MKPIGVLYIVLLLSLITVGSNLDSETTNKLDKAFPKAAADGDIDQINLSRRHRRQPKGRE